MGWKANASALAAGLGFTAGLGALLAPGAAVAPTDYGQGRPLAVVAHASGHEEVYWRGADGYLWEKAESGGQWDGPVRTPISGLASSPAATIGSHGYDYVFWEGTDGGLWEAGNYPGGWVGPTDLHMGPLGSQPTATSIPNSSGVAEIDVFWHGNQAGANLWRSSHETSTGKWSGPTEIGGMGPLGSAPTATEQGNLGRSADPGLLEGRQRRGTVGSGHERRHQVERTDLPWHGSARLGTWRRVRELRKRGRIWGGITGPPTRRVAQGKVGGWKTTRG